LGTASVKFDHVMGAPVDVREIDFETEPLRDRVCGRCGSTAFFAVNLHLFAGLGQVRRAMCEGCKLIVELA
jgi:hypothetical protein